MNSNEVKTKNDIFTSNFDEERYSTPSNYITMKFNIRQAFLSISIFYGLEKYKDTNVLLEKSRKKEKERASVRSAP